MPSAMSAEVWRDIVPNAAQDSEGSNATTAPLTQRRRAVTMFESLKIEHFRGFESLELKELARVNLIVGANNSGKTALLEAIQFLCQPGRQLCRLAF